MAVARQAAFAWVASRFEFSTISRAVFNRSAKFMPRVTLVRTTLQSGGGTVTLPEVEIAFPLGACYARLDMRPPPPDA